MGSNPTVGCPRLSIPDQCFLLTFDDGLADHAHTVLPVLQERGLRGVFFVPGAVLTSLEAKLEAAGAPWTPGRIPDWEKE